MNEAPTTDVVTGFIFTVTVAFVAITTWYREVRRLHAYSRYGASHKAKRRPQHAQLRYTTEAGRPTWLYSTTW